MRIVDVIRNGDFQTIKFDNGSEIYGSSEQDENGTWIDNRAIDFIAAHFAEIPQYELMTRVIRKCRDAFCNQRQHHGGRCDDAPLPYPDWSREETYYGRI